MFIDALRRKAVRVSGEAEAMQKSDADPRIQAAFDEAWADLLDGMSAFVRIKFTSADLILSSAHDCGATAEEWKRAN